MLEPEATRPAAGTSLGRSTALSTAATFAGYAGTLAQQIVLARALGVSANVDALAIALAWAVSTTGVVGWAIATATVPSYIRARLADPVEARRLFRTASALATGAGAVLAVVTFAAAPALASALLPGSSAGGRESLVSILRITAPLHLVWTIWILASSLANARHHYVSAALVTIVPSLIVIVTLVAEPTVLAAAAAYVVGMIAQVVVLVAIGSDWRSDLLPAFNRAAVGRVGRSIVPTGLTFLFLGAALLSVRTAASLAGPGELAALDYALRLTLAGESVLLTGALAVALTVWSEDLTGDRERLPPRHALLATAVVGLVAAGVVIGFATSIVSLLFAGGRFGSEDVGRVALALASIAPGMAARMVILLVLRLLLARQAAWTLAAVSGVALFGVTAASFAGEIMFGLAGAALGYSAGWIVAAILSLVAVHRTGRPHQAIPTPR